MTKRIWFIPSDDVQHVISEQTRVFVEEEFADVFNSARNEWPAEGRSNDEEKETLATMDDLDGKEGFHDYSLPMLAISSP